VLTGIYAVQLVGKRAPARFSLSAMLFLGWLSRIPAVVLWWVTKPTGSELTAVFRERALLALQLLLQAAGASRLQVPGC
jgi:hypothetical protein